MLIVGLGNFGKEYISTFHNIGFMTVDLLATKLNITLNKKGQNAKFYEGKIGNNKVIIAQPLTYMNASGDAVLALSQKFKVKKEEIIVIYDDIDLPEGSVRFRTKGSGGTHNGMKDVVLKIGEDVKRIRIGAGKAEKIALGDYVLSKMKGDKKEKIMAAIHRVADALEAYINSGEFKIIEDLNK